MKVCCVKVCCVKVCCPKNDNVVVIFDQRIYTSCYRSPVIIFLNFFLLLTFFYFIQLCTDPVPIIAVLGPAPFGGAPAGYRLAAH